MNKLHQIILLILILMFLLAGLWKSGVLEPEHQVVEATVEERDRSCVMEFWDHYNRATDFQNERGYENAAIYYEKALQINDEHEGSWYELGNMKLLLREFEEAEKSWLELVRINPRSARARMQLGTLYFCRDEKNRLFNPESAKEYFKKAHDLNREETGPPLHLAKIAILEGDFDEAENYTNVVLVQNFMSYQAIFLKGYIEWLKGIRESSEEKISEAYELYQTINQIRIVGEGATKSGSRPMLSEDMYCDFVGDRIEQLLESMDESNPEIQADQNFQRFDKSLEELVLSR